MGQSRRTGGKCNDIENQTKFKNKDRCDSQGGPGVAEIGVFCTASADPEGSAAYYIDMFVNVYGAANATYIPVTETSNNADDPALAELVSQQTGIFFGGGDQLRIMVALRPEGRDTLVLTAVKDLLRKGAVVGGTSAGAACLVCHRYIYFRF